MNRSYDQGLGLLMKYNMMFFVCTGFFVLFRVAARVNEKPLFSAASRGAIQIRTGE